MKCPAWAEENFKRFARKSDLIINEERIIEIEERIAMWGNQAAISDSAQSLIKTRYPMGKKELKTLGRRNKQLRAN